MRGTLHLALLLTVCAAGCGTPGAPRPPSLDLPRPVSDLAATRVGDRVTLTWTAPRETTDRTNIRHPGPTRICREVGQVAAVSCDVVGEAPPVTEAGTKKQPVRQSYTDILPIALQRERPTAFVNYAVAVLNDRGKSAGLSNQVQVPLAPTLPPPADVRAQLTADGIVLTWTGIVHEHESPALGHYYRVSRRAPETPTEIVIGEVRLSTDPHAEFVDRTFAWEKTYIYRVAVVTTVARPEGSVEVTGEPSPELQVVAHDIFPPAAPVGVQAVASGVGQPPFVDLTWAPNTESDLAGYNVYRHEAGQPPLKINAELVKAPAYRDSTAQPGRRYFYAVSAVDLRGNESARSEEASETLP